MMLGQCMACRGQSDVTITAESGGYLTHYAACWDHLEAVCARVRDDHGPRLMVVSPRIDGAIDASATETAGNIPQTTT